MDDKVGNRNDFNSLVQTILHHNVQSVSNKLLELSILLNSGNKFRHFMFYKTLTNGRTNESFKC